MAEELRASVHIILAPWGRGWKRKDDGSSPHCSLNSASAAAQHEQHREPIKYSDMGIWEGQVCGHVGCFGMPQIMVKVVVAGEGDLRR